MDNFNLKYITSGTADSLSSRKVFCAYHQNDKQKATDIFHDLMNACACTVFYYDTEPSSVSRAEAEEDLRFMNLFVLIVSSDFLFSPCFARDTAYDIAVKNRIPVLPILIESGLEESFNQKIGNLQCLTLYQERYDATTVPYAEKLRNYLSQVLSADVDADSIHKAFDTVIFLSYRKKDRSFAQRLMNLIHEDDACRNIAIWYDEFLFPGEDFNANIRTELERSSVFIMAITPHTVEKDNYIILTEYPTAVSLQKSIIPFEMEPTSTELLRQSYPGIPDPQSTANAAYVQQVILNALDTLNIRHVEDSAEKDYLIGLAYLMGICVEKNTAVGFRMIVSAAERGVSEAIRKTVLLYCNGEGVAQNYSLAAQWQNRFLSEQIAAFESAPDQPHAEAVINAYFDLADIQKQDSDLTRADQTYMDITEFCSDSRIKDNSYAKFFKATAYEAAGQLWISLGDYSKAQFSCLSKALEIRETLYNESSDPKSCLDLIETYELIAECCEACNCISQVKLHVIKIKPLISTLEPSDTRSINQYDFLKRLIICNNRLGHLYNVLNKWAEAFISIGNNIILAEKLVRISDNSDARQQLILAHLNDGDQHARNNAENHLRAALAAYSRAYKIAKELLDEESGLDVSLKSARSLAGIGCITRKLKDFSSSRTAYEQALQIYRTVHNQSDTLPITRALYTCCTAAAETYIESDQYEKAVALLSESIRLNEEVTAGTHLAVYQKDLARSLGLLGDIYNKQWDIDRALGYYTEQCSWLKKAFLGTGSILDLKIYAQALKELISVAKFAGEFDIVKKLSAELSELIDKYKAFF